MDDFAFDVINIENIEVFAKHGVYSQERELGQKFYVSLNIYTDTRTAGLKDLIDDTLNYGIIANECKEFMKKNTYSLIEAAAEMLAESLLIKYGLKIKKLELEIKKPWAPVMLHIDSVSVKITRKWHKVYLSLGSNIGNKILYINNAIETLRKEKLNLVSSVSQIIETKPYGGVEQDNFLNCCIEIYTLMYPFELLSFLNKIEDDAGRKRTVRWGPRTLDIDILFYDDLTINTERLSIPHIDMQNREFVLKPLNEIAPNKIHPILNMTVSKMLYMLNN